MEPTLADGDLVLAAAPRRVRAGDIVIVEWPHRAGQLSIKRAVMPRSAGWHVLGDNSTASTDSRHLGPARILATARWMVRPHLRRLPRATATRRHAQARRNRIPTSGITH
jgi:type IV secretory pathway protease TraF